MSSDEGGFFSRWSRRKSEVRSGATVAPEAPVQSPTVNRQAVASSTPAAQLLEGAPQQVGSAPSSVTAQPPSPVSPPTAPEQPSLTLDDVRQLTPDADFTPFVARDVAPEVRNAAFKKLFADPKFNVMDGLDIYIDDYSKPDPLPVSLARKLISAQSLGLFDEQPKPPAGASPDTGAVSTTVVSESSGEVTPAAVPPQDNVPAADPDTAPTPPPPHQP